MPTFFSLEYKVSTLYSGAVFEFLLVYLKKGVFTSVSSEYRTRAPCNGQRCLSLLRRGLSVLWGGWGERKRERKGHDGKGKERRETSGSRLFPLPVVPCALSIVFFDYCFFIWIASGSFCGGERRCLCFWITWAGIGRLMISVQCQWPISFQHIFEWPRDRWVQRYILV